MAKYVVKNGDNETVVEGVEGLQLNEGTLFLLNAAGAAVSIFNFGFWEYVNKVE